MTADSETENTIPAWLPDGVLAAIRWDAGRIDPERVQRAIDRADDILRAHCAFSADEAIDVKLARSALLVARAMLRQWPETVDD